MTDFKILIVSVDERTIVPTLLVHVQFSFPFGREALVGISGELLSANGMDIGQITECRHSDTKSLYLTPHDDIKEQNAHLENVAQTTLACPLSKAAIEHIEQLRDADPMHGVQLHFKFRLRRMELPASLQPKLIERNNPFVGIHIQKEERSYSIEQSKWVNEFARPLGIGDFITVELGIPKEEVPERWQKVFDHLKGAVVDMREAMDQHDWQKALILSRKFFESIKFDLRLRDRVLLKAELKAIFTRQGYGDEAFDDLYLGVLHLFDYASKFVHNLDRKGNYFTEPMANREDAFLMFNLVVSLLNLLHRKLRSI